MKFANACSSVVVAILVFFANAGRAQTTLFTQNFSSSTVPANYVGSSTNLFDAITAGANTTISAAANNLSFAKSGTGTSFFVRNTDLSPTPSLLAFQFDLNVTGNLAAQSGTGISNGLSLYLGSGLTTTATAETAATSITARINIGWSATPGEWNLLRGGTSGASTNQSGSQTVRWFINNGAGASNYTGPDSAGYSIANNTYDLWIGTNRVFSGTSITTTGLNMTDFKFRYDTGAGNATVAFDNISLTNLTAIPEPSTYGVLVGALVLSAGLIRRQRKSSRFG